METRLFESVETMIGTDAVSAIVGTAIDSVERTPFQTPGYSGNTLQHVIASNSRGETIGFVLKHFSIEQDWIMRHSKDLRVREVALFRHSIYGHLPSGCYAPVVAVAREGSSWASLMVDVSDTLLPRGDTPIPPNIIKQCLDHLAALHTVFMDDDSLADPALGLCSLPDSILLLSPSVGRHETELGWSNEVTDNLVRGWDLFQEIAYPEAARVIGELQRDIQPLTRALGGGPYTLLHGDYKFANLGTWSGSMELRGKRWPQAAGAPGGIENRSEPHTIMLDWGVATFGPPLFDLGWFLAVNSAKLSVSKEEAAQMYRESLHSYGFTYSADSWERELQLGLLAGGAMRLGWAKALGTLSDDPAVRERESAELAWWSEQIMLAARWLE